jgi:hypothetical protein
MDKFTPYLQSAAAHPDGRAVMQDRALRDAAIEAGLVVPVGYGVVAITDKGREALGSEDRDMTPAVSEEMVERLCAIAQDHLEIDYDGDEPYIRNDSVDAAIRAALSTLAQSAAASERLFDQNHPMADGEERMTAAEDVLAWLVIEKCGCPDDTPITPKEASDTIAGMIDHLRKYEDAALASPSAEAAQPVAIKRYGLMFMNGTPYIGEKAGGSYVDYNDVAALQGELREALKAVARWDNDTLNDFLPPFIGKAVRAALSPKLGEEKR